MNIFKCSDTNDRKKGSKTVLLKTKPNFLTTKEVKINIFLYLIF